MFEERLEATFPGKVISKALARSQPFDRLPRYVAEYLIAKFAPTPQSDRLQALREFVLRHYPLAEHRSWAEDQLMRSGRLVLIDELRVRPDLATGGYAAQLSSLSHLRVHVPADVCEQHPRALYGLWGTMELRYDPRSQEIRLARLVPFQVLVDVEEFIQGRAAFSEQEWLAVLLAAVGLRADALTERQRFLALARLTPLVEPRLHLMELGPRQTGKSFLLRNTSADVFLVSSSTVSPATLFYHQGLRRQGLISTYPVVVFDEVAHGRWIDRELLGTLNDFMETGRFTRGAQQFTAQTSLVFLGNTDDPTVPQTQFLPGSLTREAGFFDRLSALIPGHEMPKIHGELLDVDRGLAVDYLAEILRMLRTRVVPVSVGTKVPSEFTERDVRAVQKLVSAFAKLLYPGGDWPEDRIAVWTDFAIELREQVNKELSFLNPIEFPPRRVSSSSLAASPETEADQRTEETVTE